MALKSVATTARKTITILKKSNDTWIISSKKAKHCSKNLNARMRQKMKLSAWVMCKKNSQDYKNIKRTRNILGYSNLLEKLSNWIPKYPGGSCFIEKRLQINPNKRLYFSLQNIAA